MGVCRCVNGMPFGVILGPNHNRDRAVTEDELTNKQFVVGDSGYVHTNAFYFKNTSLLLCQCLESVGVLWSF